MVVMRAGEGRKGQKRAGEKRAGVMKSAAPLHMHLLLIPRAASTSPSPTPTPPPPVLPTPTPITHPRRFPLDQLPPTGIVRVLMLEVYHQVRLGLGFRGSRYPKTLKTLEPCSCLRWSTGW